MARIIFDVKISDAHMCRCSLTFGTDADVSVSLISKSRKLITCQMDLKTCTYLRNNASIIHFFSLAFQWYGLAVKMSVFFNPYYELDH